MNHVIATLVFAVSLWSTIALVVLVINTYIRGVHTNINAQTLFVVMMWTMFYYLKG